MTAMGVSAPDQAILQTILGDFADKIDQVAIFGSRATGRARRNSDIDLVVYGALSEADIDRLWTLFDESSISVSVDVVAYDDALFPPLRRHIDRTRQLLITGDELRNRYSVASSHS